MNHFLMVTAFDVLTCVMYFLVPWKGNVSTQNIENQLPPIKNTPYKVYADTIYLSLFLRDRYLPYLAYLCNMSYQGSGLESFERPYCEINVVLKFKENIFRKLSKLYCISMFYVLLKTGEMFCNSLYWFYHLCVKALHQHISNKSEN